MSELAIIIVSYNTKDDLVACLHALDASPPRVAHDIVVVDNGSHDGSVAAVRAGWPDVHAIEAGGNLGYAKANNLGIRSTHSDLVLLLNSDTIVPAGAVDALVARLRHTPGAGIVGPRLVNAAGRPELSFGRMIGPLNELVQKAKGMALESRIPVAGAWVERSLEHPRYTDWVSGACLLVRRSDADAVGLLDERFFLYGEDVDFCAAVRGLGRTVLFAPDIEVVHHRGRSGAAQPARTRSLYRRSQLAFYAKHHPRWVPLLRWYLRAKGETSFDTGR